MDIRPTGGIFARLDSSGNLNFYNSAGTSLAKFVGSNFSAPLNKGSSVTNGTIFQATALTSDRTAGASLQITPQSSGNVLIIVNAGSVANNAAGDGALITVYESLGANNPTDGNVPDGSKIAAQQFVSVAANDQSNVFFAFIRGGLTLGQAYTYEVAKAAITGGTVTFSAPASFPVTGIIGHEI